MRRCLLVAVVLVSACAPKLAPAPPVVTAPKFPDFMRPAVPRGVRRHAWPCTGESRGWAFLQAGDLQERRARAGGGAEADAGVLSGRNLARVRRAGAQGSEGGAGAFRSRARAEPAARRCLGAGRTRPGAARRSNREVDALAAFEAAVAADPSQADLARRVEVLRFRDRGAGAGARARGGEGRPSGRGERRRTWRRLRARPTARSSIASSPASSGRRATTDRRARALPQGGRARSERRGLAGADRRDPRGRRRFRGGGEGLRRVAGHRAERGRRGAARGGARASRRWRCCRAEYRAHRSGRRRSRARDLAALVGIRLGDAAAERAAGERGADHRRAQQLGGALDHGGRARRRHGAVRQPRLPAAGGRAPRRSRAGGGAAARARPSARDPAAGETVGVGAREVQRSLGRPSGVSGGVGGGRGRRPRRPAPATASSRRRPVTGAEAIDALDQDRGAVAGRR